VDVDRAGVVVRAVDVAKAVAAVRAADVAREVDKVRDVVKEEDVVWDAVDVLLVPAENAYVLIVVRLFNINKE